MKNRIAAAALAAALLPTAVPAGASPVASEISAPGPDGPLAGTLLSAEKASAPVVLIVPGSGPTDRDGNSPLGITSASYRLLAEALAQKGISAARIDKRGMFGSKGAVADANKVTIAAYAADIGAWARSLTERTGQHCIWVAGHSEGGLVAIAAEADPHVCGLILISAMGRPFDVVLREQLAANPANAPILPDADGALDRLAKGEHVDVSAMHPALARGLFNPAVQDYLIDLIGHDPAAMLAATTKPVLIVAGTADLQIPLADAEKLKAARPDATLSVIKGMTHVLKQASARDRAANMATYTDPSLAIDRSLVADIVRFVRANSH